MVDDSLEEPAAGSSEGEAEAAPQPSAELDATERPTRSFPVEPEGEDERSAQLAGLERPASSRRRLAIHNGAVIPGTPYQVVRWLGDGGMGSVFEAEHIDIERRVAVKVLHSRSSRRAWITQAFRNEARTSARIGSPHIVDILVFKELEDGRLLIAMEFLDGDTLRPQIDEQLVTGPRMVAIVRQVCKGLHAAHGAGIVHRDVKPENIMLVQREGRGDFVKLVDFGVAKFLRDDSSSRVVGTAQYMAPEISMGEGDARADVYAVGCLLYEIACGAPVFDGDDPGEVMARHRAETPVVPSKRSLAQSLPPQFDSIVMRCLEKDPDERYQTMAEVEAALVDLQLDQGWTTPWDDLEPPDVDPERRSALVAGLAALTAPPERARAEWPRLLLMAMLLVAGVGLVALWPGGRASVAESDEIEALTTSARAAAARFYFIYPPHDDPQGPTAYREVLALEVLDREAARERASALREEFAATLVRLGDRYWDFMGARPFAHEYYASALMFADDEHAQGRIDLTVVALERLRGKAARGDFTEHELLASEALAALADPDPEQAAEKLAEIQQGAVSVTMQRSLHGVLAHPEFEGHRPPEAGASAASEVPAAALASGVEDPRAEGSTGGEVGITDEMGSTGATSEPASEGALPVEPPIRSGSGRRPSEARALVAEAERALRRGDSAGAETLLHQALAADRRSLGALDGLAQIAFDQARYVGSVKFLERAVRVGSRSAKRWLSLGDAYFKSLRYEDARRAYARAQELGSGEAAARIAKVDHKLGRR